MPDVSIMITAQDNYSSAIKSMSQTTKSFSKQAEDMEEVLHRLNTNKTTLKLDADAALKGLKDAQKQFADTGREADGLKVQLAQANYDNVKRNLDLVTKGAREAERQMQNTGEAFRKAENRGGFGGGFKSVVSALAISGIGDAAKQILQQGAGAVASSAFGSEGGNLVSGALSTATTGASAGFMFGGIPGAALGAAIGAGVGLVSGGIQNFQKRDDAFKSYVQENTEAQLSQRDSDIQSGSGIAAQREQDALAFNTLLGEGMGDTYLTKLRAMAAKTPMEYEDLTAMSRSLATGFKDDPERMQDLMKSIGNAGSAVGADASSMNTMATAMSRMQASGKVTLEYLNLIQERGVDAVGMLAEGLGKSKGEIYEDISKGAIDGATAVDILQAKMDELYGGSMERQSKTFAGLSSTLSDAEKEMQNAYGEGYNTERGKGIKDQTDWLSDSSGEAQQEANEAIGAWQASLENAKEKYIRDAVDGAMETDEYKKAKAEGDAAEMGRIIMQAKVRGQGEYNANEGKDEVLASELALADGIRGDARSNKAFWDAGYLKGENYTRGVMAGIDEVDISGITGFDSGDWRKYADPNYEEPTKHAWGLNRVPRDNFPALLHEGERVLTAREARQQDSGGASIQIDVHDNSFSGTVEQQADQIMRIVAPKLIAARAVQAPK